MRFQCKETCIIWYTLMLPYRTISYHDTTGMLVNNNNIIHDLILLKNWTFTPHHFKQEPFEMLW